MKFIDEAIIKIAAGHGGRGCVAFRREKYVPRGGPNGGNGAKGGDIILLADEGLTTLLDLKHKTHFEAERGEHGLGSMMDGRSGLDITIRVPVGTLVYDHESGEILVDLNENGQSFVAAKGGRGGKGNTFFKSSTRQAPDFAQPGEEGIARILKLELKLLADVGLVGFPNAGKSTFLTLISRARPKVADYPFTTLVPQLGVVSHKSYPAFTVADIPGLIEGAHRGTGLGIQFLKHIERTRLFLHLISLGPDEPGEPFDRFLAINKELVAFDPSFAKRKQVVVLTKKDLIATKKQLDEKMKPFQKKKYQVYPISAVTRDGLDDLMEVVAKGIIR